MPFIYLHRLDETKVVRVDPDEIREIDPLEQIEGSMVIFKNNDWMRYSESPKQIHRKEWKMRYLWPNLESLVVATIGGILGSVVTLLIQAIGK